MEITWSNDEIWMQRCFDLAVRGTGYVSPNPPVGAVLVYENNIISEGYHTHFGGPHAEVMLFQNISTADRRLIPKSTLYVSLEPCCVYNKTPPCTDLLIKEGIKDVRISTLDPNPKVAGRGVAILKSNNIIVREGILEDQGKELIKAFTTNILLEKPYVILKWAQSKEGYIGKKEERVLISHPYTLAWSHQLRSNADAILVGAGTVRIDDPSLTTREAVGRSPHRAVYDPERKLHMNYKVFNDDGCKVFYFSSLPNETITGNHIAAFVLDDKTSHVTQIMTILFAQNIGILLVEGGAYLLSMFISENEWDETWTIQSKHALEEGFKAPVTRGRLIQKFESATDTVVGIKNEMKGIV